MQIKINNNKKELKIHGSEEYPILISHELLSRYDKGYFLNHWHPELEFTYIIEGEILYSINGLDFWLKKGQGIFCNQNVLHSGRKVKMQDCNYLSVTFLPKLIYGFEQSRIKTKYIDRIIKNPFFPQLLLVDTDENTDKILKNLSEIYKMSNPNNEINELKTLVFLSDIWMNLYHCYEKQKIKYPQNIDYICLNQEKELNRLRILLEYIHKNYDKKILLEEISNSIGLCPNECCRFFKKNMNITINGYLLSFRIEKSLYLLDYTDCSITEIAYNIGFSSASYYTHLFHRHMGITPLQYRNRKKKQTTT